MTSFTKEKKWKSIVNCQRLSKANRLFSSSCRNGYSTWLRFRISVVLLRFLYDQYTCEWYGPAYPPIGGINSIITVLWQMFWHWITHKGWQVINSRNVWRVHVIDEVVSILFFTITLKKAMHLFSLKLWINSGAEGVPLEFLC